MKKNSDSRAKIVAAYVEYWKEHEKSPRSVHHFCKLLKLPERDFYRQFASLDAVESHFWRQFVSDIVARLKKGGEWAGFSAEEKVLAFLFAFFERALDERGFVALRFGGLSPLCQPLWLAGFREEHESFIRCVISEAVQSKQFASRGSWETLYPKAFHLHLRGLIDFNLKDNSAEYEKTDVLIEKSVRLAFDLLRSATLESAIDLGKWLLQSGINPFPRGSRR
ncbi:hypothetical protein QPK87_09305 [Kamptonema cortianum]|nr:hypothetical protein [Kamptonema cortianum]MDL5046157.1 hypothetical protein [Oscillatoria amoena NRMC-F 0135]